MRECAGCKHSDIFTYGDENPMLKCCRYPPQVIFDSNDDVVVHYFPYAIHPCGEWAPVAGKTQRVIGRTTKGIRHALDILGHLLHLRTVRRDRDHTHDHEADQAAS